MIPFYGRMNTKNSEIFHKVELLFLTQFNRESGFCKKPPDMLPRTKGPGSPSCLCCWRTRDWTTQRMQNTASHQPASEAAKELGSGTGRNSVFFQQNPDIKTCLASSSTWKVLSKKNPDKNGKDFFHYLSEHANPNKKLRRSNEALSTSRPYRGCENIPRSPQEHTQL